MKSLTEHAASRDMLTHRPIPGKSSNTQILIEETATDTVSPAIMVQGRIKALHNTIPGGLVVNANNLDTSLRACKTARMTLVLGKGRDIRHLTHRQSRQVS